MHVLVSYVLRFTISKLRNAQFLLTGTASTETKGTGREKEERSREVTKEGDGEKEKDRGTPKVSYFILFVCTLWIEKFIFENVQIE